MKAGGGGCPAGTELDAGSGGHKTPSLVRETPREKSPFEQRLRQVICDTTDAFCRRVQRVQAWPVAIIHADVADMAFPYLDAAQRTRRMYDIREGSARRNTDVRDLQALIQLFMRPEFNRSEDPQQRTDVLAARLLTALLDNPLLEVTVTPLSESPELAAAMHAVRESGAAITVLSDGAADGVYTNVERAASVAALEDSIVAQTAAAKTLRAGLRE